MGFAGRVEGRLVPADAHHFFGRILCAREQNETSRKEKGAQKERQKAGQTMADEGLVHVCLQTNERVWVRKAIDIYLS